MWSDWLFIVVGGAVVLAGLGRRYRRRIRLSSSKVHVAVSGSVRRGENVPLAITIRDGADASLRLRAGIVCLERYDVEEETTVDQPGMLDSQTTRRVTNEAVAHEEWREVSASEAQQGLTFAIPVEAPFSYRGSCLSFEWHAEAHEIARLRPDAVASYTFEVLP